MTYRVRDWAAHYENNRSKEIKKLEWVPVPNRMDGDGYTELIDHPAGPAHLGAWLAMVQIASRCDPRGTLVRDGGKPHDSASLSRISRIPAKVFDEAIPRFVSIGWIEAISEAPQEGAVIPHLPAVTPHPSAGLPQEPANAPPDKSHPPANATTPESQEGAASRAREKEGKKERTEVKEGIATVLPFPVSLESLVSEAAQRMYGRHPKKKLLALVPDALTKAANSFPDPVAALIEIEACHAAWVLDPDWTKKNGDFAPKLAEWIADLGYTAWPESDPRGQPKHPVKKDPYIFTPMKDLLWDGKVDAK